MCFFFHAEDFHSIYMDHLLESGGFTEILPEIKTSQAAQGTLVDLGRESISVDLEFLVPNCQMLHSDPTNLVFLTDPV